MRENLAKLASQILNENIEKQNVSLLVIDQLSRIATEHSEVFSDKFLEVMHEYQRRYDAIEPLEALDYSKRLYAILTLEEDILRIRNSSNGYDLNLLPLFELNEDDKSRISTLCSQMRKIVYAATQFDGPHKVRLLNRIAAIEAEILKPKGHFDVLRGGLTDLSETLGIFGTNIKPLTDRMNEVVGIARRNTKDYDKLPAPEETLSLPAPEQDSSDD